MHEWRRILKDSAISVIPIMAIVVLLHFFLSPLPGDELFQFLVGGALLIVGLSVFLIGTDIGMVPFGQRVGSALTHRRSLFLLIVISFAIGFAITIAEPDVQVLTTQVHDVAPEVNKSILLIMIAIGVGFFLVIAMLRVLLRISLPLLLMGFYALTFFACFFIEPGFVGVAFDSGGATTGPVTVPFIMAIGIGVAATVKNRDGGNDSFGFVGLASIGPIAAVALMGLLFSVTMRPGLGHAEDAAVHTLAGRFLHEVPHVAKDIALALMPLLAIFLVFQVTIIRLPHERVRRMLFGLAYAFIGLVIFMVGVNGGFSPVGKSLGLGLGTLAGGWALLPVGLLLGAVVVCAEPAVWVLTEQVEEVSGGTIARGVMLAALSISIALAVGLGMLRVVTRISIWWMLVPGYVLSLVLTRFCPPMFTAIAFDSGGVASGPMSTTFILALTLGAAVSCGGDPATDAFGMVAMIAMAPLITIQLLGLVYKVMEKRQAAAVRGKDNNEPQA